MQLKNSFVAAMLSACVLFAAGTLSAADVARRASPTPIDISGNLMINTTDYFDDAIGCTIILDRVNVVGSSALTVSGKGILRMAFDKNAMRFDCVEVRTGATFDPSYGATTNRGPVQTRRCVLANGSHLVLTAGKTWLMADTITDGGADVTVAIPSGLADGWYPIVQGKLGGTLPSSIVASVMLSGDSAGWSIAVREGTLFVKKTTSASTGSYKHEWTGAAGTDAWSDAVNWHCGVAPTWDDWPSAKDFIPCFGACGGGTLYYDTSRDNAKQFLWLLTADSFMLKSRNTDGTANENRFMTVTRNDVKANSGLYSLASTPQYIDFPIRLSNRMTWCSAGRGSLVQRGIFYPSNASEKDMAISGDVRYGGNNVSTPIYHITLLDPYKDAPFTRLTIMNGGNMKVSQQTRVVDYQSSASTSIRIEEGGALTFAGDEAQYFGWNCKPAMNVIDGTLVLECPIAGGVDQMYVGKGTMKVSTVRPQTADSRVTIGGGLTLEAPAWATVNTTDPTKAFALSVESDATLRATADFTYGAADGLGDGVNADARAIEIAAGAELLVDGNGHSVTFADDIVGSGRMVLSNGTFSIEGSASGSIVVTSDATICLGREMAADAVEFQSGATLSISGAGSISVASGDIDLSGVKLTHDGILGSGWYLLARTGSGTISGDFDSNLFDRKIVVVDGVSALYIKKHVGIRVIVR